MSDPRQAGWLADPTRRYHHRYWDGSRWTDQVSRGGQATVDPLGTEPDPPAAVPTGEWAPPPAPTARRGAWPWALAAGLAAFVIGVGGCVAATAIGVNRLADEIRDRSDRHAITMEQFEEVELGMTRDEVLDLLDREPRSSAEWWGGTVFGDDDAGDDCITYVEDGDLWFPSFRFCFDADGVLTSKAAV